LLGLALVLIVLGAIKAGRDELISKPTIEKLEHEYMARGDRRRSLENDLAVALAEEKPSNVLVFDTSRPRGA
jgi:hypothetical protein